MSFIANYEKSAKLLTAVSAGVLAILAFVPVEKFGFPNNVVEIYRYSTMGLFIVISAYIAARSRSSDPKSQKATLQLALALGVAASILLMLLLTFSESLIGEAETECAAQERQLFVMPLNPNTAILRLIEEQSDIEDSSDWRAGIENLVCERTFGRTMWREVEKSNNLATLTLVALLVSIATTMFTAITLMLWSLIALEKRRAA